MLLVFVIFIIPETIKSLTKMSKVRRTEFFNFIFR